MARMNLGEAYLKAIRHKEQFPELMQAQVHFAEAFRVVEICNGPQHELTIQLKRSLTKLDEAMAKKCANASCAKLGSQACAGCKKVSYCGEACQKAHWKRSHKEA